MVEDFRLATPEAIEVSYDIAGIGTRFLAQLVDVIAIAGIIGVVGAGVVFLSTVGSLGNTAATIVIPATSFLVLFGYFTLYEAFWSGQTPGKRALQVRVIKVGGYPIGFVESFIRNLIRLLDLMPTAYGVGIITMFISTHSRRLGDYAAGTIVVKERVDSLPATPSTQAQSPTHSPVRSVGGLDPDELDWNLHLLAAADLTIIAEYLERAPSLPPDARTRIGNQIATGIAGRIGAREPLDAVRFLARVQELAREGR